MCAQIADRLGGFLGCAAWIGRRPIGAWGAPRRGQAARANQMNFAISTCNPNPVRAQSCSGAGFRTKRTKADLTDSDSPSFMLRQPPTHSPLISNALAALAVLCVLCVGSGAEASIVGGHDALRPSDTFCLDRLGEALEQLAAGDQSGAGETGASNDTPAPPTSPHENEGDSSPDYAYLLPGSGSSGGSTSSTSSVGASGSGSAPALLATAAALFSDDSPARRFAFEHKLMLPAAPGTELLRPPQV